MEEQRRGEENVKGRRANVPGRGGVGYELTVEVFEGRSRIVPNCLNSHKYHKYHQCPQLNTVDPR
jgi:hypothetical protein